MRNETTSNVTNVTAKPKAKPVQFSATLGQFRTLKDGQAIVTLTTDSGELPKILELVTACQAGHSLVLSAKIDQKKKDAQKKPDTKNKQGPRRVRRYPYK